MALPSFVLSALGKLKDDRIRLNTYFGLIKTETDNLQTNITNGDQGLQAQITALTPSQVPAYYKTNVLNYAGVGETIYDGVTSAVSAINAALLDMPPNGTLYFPNLGAATYLIDSDITLADITLEFEPGAYIKGAYTLTGSNTKINAGLNKIFNTDVLFDGTWLNTEYYSEWFGAISDGIVDCGVAINKCISSFSNCTLIQGTYATSATILLSLRGKSLVGKNCNTRNEYPNASVIKYIGTAGKKVAVVQVGSNAVGSEPTIDCTNNVVKNLCIDSNNLAGFGIYATYITGQTIIDNLYIKQSTEYNGFFAQGWYATITNITSYLCKGNGLAFGMPLEYMDGTSETWSASGELNQIKIDNVRSLSAGTYYHDNPGTYDPTNAAIRRKGYGIGAGFGNGFSLNNFISEKSGGVGLYYYTGAQVRQTVSQGYLENNAYLSGLDAASTKPEIIIENLSTSGTGHCLRDVFVNYESGGIYHTGTQTVQWLKNLYQPRFLSSLDGLDSYTLYSFLLKDNVYYMCGYYNTQPYLMGNTIMYGAKDTGTSWSTLTCPPTPQRSAIYIKGDGTTPVGTYTITYESGTTSTKSFPTLTTDYILAFVTNANLVSISKSGATGGSSTVTFKVVTVEGSYY